jgi:hypothetical protein
MIRGTCPVCGRIFKVDDRYAGMTGRCKACGATIRVPGEPDDGLNGLSSVAGSEPAEAPLTAPTPPEGETPLPPPPVEPAEPVQAPPQPPPPAPHEPVTPPPEPERPQAAQKPLGPHDARSRYEPNHGPTALDGSWLRDEPGGNTPGAGARGNSGPPADEVLSSSRIVTELEPTPTVRRPAILVVACVVLGLLAAGFFIHFVTAGPTGAAAAGIGVVLAGMGILRLWTAYWDGMAPAVLFCLCVGGGAFLRSQTPVLRTIFLAGAACALLLLILAALLRSSREYFNA